MYTATDRHATQIAELIAPQGRLGLIDDPGTIDVRLFKRKSMSIHWEFMYTRSMFETADIEVQSRLLDEVARLENGRARGKIVLEGFGA